MENLILKTRKQYPKKIKKFLRIFENDEITGWDISKQFRSLFPVVWAELSTLGVTLGGSVPLKVAHMFCYGLPNATCLECGGEVLFKNAKRAYNTFCSHSCRMRSDHTKKRRESASFEKWGVCHPSQAEPIRKKYKKTMLARHGVANPFSKGGKIREAIEKKFIATYGGKSPMSCPKVRADTNKLYTTGNPMGEPHNLEKYLKSRYTQKRVKVAGRTIKVLGYEHFAIRSIKDKIDKIVVRPSKMPRLIYELGGTTHRYYPDMRVLTKKGNKLLIEVKSTFTLKRDLEKNLKKFKVANKWCMDNGYVFLLCVSTPSGTVTWVERPNKRKIQGLL